MNGNHVCNPLYGWPFKLDTTTLSVVVFLNFYFIEKIKMQTPKKRKICKSKIKLNKTTSTKRVINKTKQTYTCCCGLFYSFLYVSITWLKFSNSSAYDSIGICSMRRMCVCVLWCAIAIQVWKDRDYVVSLCFTIWVSLRLEMDIYASYWWVR